MSDDDDLLSAYEVASKDLQCNLKLTVIYKPQLQVEEAADKKTKKVKKATPEEKKKKTAAGSKKKTKKSAVTGTQEEASFSEDQPLRDRAKTID